MQHGTAAEMQMPFCEKTQMANYTAEVMWQRGDLNFLDHRYSRKHLVRFDGGVAFAGSSSPMLFLWPCPMRRQSTPKRPLWPHCRVATCSGFCRALLKLGFAWTVMWTSPQA